MIVRLTVNNLFRDLVFLFYDLKYFYIINEQKNFTKLNFKTKRIQFNI